MLNVTGRLVVLRYILQNVKGKSSSQMVAFFNPKFAKWVHANIGSMFILVNVNFFSPNCNKFAVAIVRFLKKFKIWGFFEKLEWFSEKNLSFCQIC